LCTRGRKFFDLHETNQSEIAQKRSITWPNRSLAIDRHHQTMANRSQRRAVEDAAHAECAANDSRLLNEFGRASQRRPKRCSRSKQNATALRLLRRMMISHRNNSYAARSAKFR
jgi:hypothetical protein